MINKKKVLVLNLPNKEQITRRYMCSYVSPESLLPPHELISVAAIAREWKNADVKLIDAIAEGWETDRVAVEIYKYQPDIIVSITGFECFEEDMDELRSIKSNFPESKMILFGHYATNFSQETLKHSNADYIILGEPDLIFSDLYDAIIGNLNIETVEGIAYTKNNKFIKQGNGNRIPNPNDLPMPCYDILPKDKYYEPLLSSPFGMIQSARGCPYQCNFCVKSFGTQLTTLNPERIVEEIKVWQQLFNVKSIRFIDDTFTINRKRVIELCKLMVNKKLDIEWACLSRTDNVDAEILSWMKKAGCKRIYFGMESGSKRMLELYKKNFTLEQSKEAFSLCRKYKIESAAFFMSGHPEETEADFKATVDFAVNSDLNFASFNPLTPYPGTSMFNEMSNQLDFSIYPYKNNWKDESVYKEFARRKKIFYKAFYFRPSYFYLNASALLKNMKEIAGMGFGLIRYILWDKKFVISGLKGAHDK
ncbi:MAG: radical SAM protein [Chitinophagales bacterium]